jgi:hypothetical protein
VSKKKALQRWWLRGALAFGVWLVLLWGAGVALPEDGSFPWWYTLLMIPIYPGAALSQFILPDDTAGFWLPALMMAFVLAQGAAIGAAYGWLHARRQKRHTR